MDEEKQRIAIAEECPSLQWNADVDPLNDLNAMHDAVESLDRMQKTSFHSVLHRLVGIHNARTGEERYATEATAAQRAEAFLRALGKWEESSITKTPHA